MDRPALPTTTTTSSGAAAAAVMGVPAATSSSRHQQQRQQQDIVVSTAASAPAAALPVIPDRVACPSQVPSEGRHDYPRNRQPRGTTDASSSGPVLEDAAAAARHRRDPGDDSSRRRPLHRDPHVFPHPLLNRDVAGVEHGADLINRSSVASVPTREYVHAVATANDLRLRQRESTRANATATFTASSTSQMSLNVSAPTSAAGSRCGSPPSRVENNNSHNDASSMMTPPASSAALLSMNASRPAAPLPRPGGDSGPADEPSLLSLPASSSVHAGDRGHGECRSFHASTTATTAAPQLTASLSSSPSALPSASWYASHRDPLLQRQRQDTAPRETELLAVWAAAAPATTSRRAYHPSIESSVDGIVHDVMAAKRSGHSSPAAAAGEEDYGSSSRRTSGGGRQDGLVVTPARRGAGGAASSSSTVTGVGDATVPASRTGEIHGIDAVRQAKLDAVRAFRTKEATRDAQLAEEEQREAISAAEAAGRAVTMQRFSAEALAMWRRVEESKRAAIVRDERQQRAQIVNDCAVRAAVLVRNRNQREHFIMAVVEPALDAIVAEERTSWAALLQREWDARHRAQRMTIANAEEERRAVLVSEASEASLELFDAARQSHRDAARRTVAREHREARGLACSEEASSRDAIRRAEHATFLHLQRTSVEDEETVTRLLLQGGTLEGGGGNLSLRSTTTGGTSSSSSWLGLWVAMQRSEFALRRDLRHRLERAALEFGCNDSDPSSEQGSRRRILEAETAAFQILQVDELVDAEATSRVYLCGGRGGVGWGGNSSSSGEEGVEWSAMLDAERRLRIDIEHREQRSAIEFGTHSFDLGCERGARRALEQQAARLWITNLEEPFERELVALHACGGYFMQLRRNEWHQRQKLKCRLGLNATDDEEDAARRVILNSQQVQWAEGIVWPSERSWLVAAECDARRALVASCQLLRRQFIANPFDRERRRIERADLEAAESSARRVHIVDPEESGRMQLRFQELLARVVCEESDARRSLSRDVAAASTRLFARAVGARDELECSELVDDESQKRNELRAAARRAWVIEIEHAAELSWLIADEIDRRRELEHRAAKAYEDYLHVPFIAETQRVQRSDVENEEARLRREGPVAAEQAARQILRWLAAFDHLEVTETCARQALVAAAESSRKALLTEVFGARDSLEISELEVAELAARRDLQQQQAAGWAWLRGDDALAWLCDAERNARLTLAHSETAAAMQWWTTGIGERYDLLQRELMAAYLRSRDDTVLAVEAADWQGLVQQAVAGRAVVAAHDAATALERAVASLELQESTSRNRIVLEQGAAVIGDVRLPATEGLESARRSDLAGQLLRALWEVAAGQLLRGLRLAEIHGRAAIRAEEQAARDALAAEQSAAIGEMHNRQRLEKLEAKARRVARPFLGFQLAERHVHFSRHGTISDPLHIDAIYTDGPAHRQGLRLRDEILQVGGIDVTSLAHVRHIMQQGAKVGGRVVLKVRRQRLDLGAPPEGSAAFRSPSATSAGDDRTSDAGSAAGTGTGSQHLGVGSWGGGGGSDGPVGVPSASGRRSKSPMAMGGGSSADLRRSPGADSAHNSLSGGRRRSSAAPPLPEQAAVTEEFTVEAEVLTAEREYAELTHLFFDTAAHERVELPKSDASLASSGPPQQQQQPGGASTSSAAGSSAAASSGPSVFAARRRASRPFQR